MNDQILILQIYTYYVSVFLIYTYYSWCLYILFPQGSCATERVHDLTPGGGNDSFASLFHVSHIPNNNMTDLYHLSDFQHPFETNIVALGQHVVQIKHFAFTHVHARWVGGRVLG